jgi:molybdopterin-binding protein
VKKTCLQVRDLHIDLAEFHLRDANLDIAAGEYFVILGPTGAGKTVLLEAIAGLHVPRGGKVLINDEDMTGVPPERRGVGFVYQDYILFPHLSVAQNIAFGLGLRGMASERAAERVREMSHLLGVEHLLHRRPDTLSGGEQQRVALARALVVEPRLLLLDEPLSALDPETREGLQRELARIHKQLGTTTVHVTHDFEEAIALGSLIAVLNEGRIVQVGSPDEIFRRPASAFVARFVGARNVFSGEVRARHDGGPVLAWDGLEIAVVTDLVGSAHGAVRPEDIVIAKAPFRSSMRNMFQGHITNVVNKGAVVQVTVTVPPDFVCLITRRSWEEMALQEGMPVYIAFKASAVHVF